MIPFHMDNEEPTFCPVKAAVRIIHQAVRLHVPHLPPIGVFRASTMHTYFITSSMTPKFLRTTAQHKHGPLKPVDLKRWSSHSIRVSAAVALHRARFMDSFIQTRLRWKSTAFLCYLRNTHYTAMQHTNAVSLHKYVTGARNLKTPRHAVHSVIRDVPIARRSILSVKQ